jgi:hypothetical protein
MLNSRKSTPLHSVYLALQSYVRLTAQAIDFDTPTFEQCTIRLAYSDLVVPHSSLQAIFWPTELTPHQPAVIHGRSVQLLPDGKVAVKLPGLPDPVTVDEDDCQLYLPPPGGALSKETVRKLLRLTEERSVHTTATLINRVNRIYLVTVGSQTFFWPADIAAAQLLTDPEEAAMPHTFSLRGKTTGKLEWRSSQAFCEVKLTADSQPIWLEALSLQT